MKKAILSPLCSAFVIPGMGQIINQHLKKGLFMLLAVFLLLIFFIVHLYQRVIVIIKAGDMGTTDPMGILDKLMTDDPFILYGSFVGFCILWLYSVVDAFIVGMKEDKLSPGDQ